VSAVVWLHGDSLSPTDPALEAMPDAPALFVFDRPFLEGCEVAFPRLAFMYQGVRDVAATRPVEIVVGGIGEELAAFAARHGASELHVTRNFTPQWEQTLSDFERRTPGVEVLVYEPDRLTSYRGTVRRFFGFWKKVEAEVLGGNSLYAPPRDPLPRGPLPRGHRQPGKGWR
jgi:deoxyribodipyrimidine photo-lyase